MQKNLTHFGALALSLVMSGMATAQVLYFQTASDKTYRQLRNGIAFGGGTFTADLFDGGGVYVGGCQSSFYYPPCPRCLSCREGTNTFLSFGRVGAAFADTPYFISTSIVPARVIAPRLPNLCFFRAGPASDLPRPDAPFSDDSYGLYYNLHTVDVQEYVVSGYNFQRDYRASQRSKFEKEIVTGVYYYTFPRLGDTRVKVPVANTIFPMPERYEKKGNVKSGVRFLPDTRYTKNGFIELSPNRPNTIRWEGFKPGVVVPTADTLYFSVRYLTNPKNPRSRRTTVDPVTGFSPVSIFPNFANGDDPKIALRNPFVTEFTLPPVIQGGVSGIIELELVRNLRTSGIALDTSKRVFQLPVIVVNRYTDYATERLGEGVAKTGLLEDFDGDGFNNMTEWILDSRAENSGSIPVPPVPVANPAVIDPVTGIIDPGYFGFTVIKKRGTVPAVRYTLQRSTNGGRTYSDVTSDANWLLTSNPTLLRLESLSGNQPPGTNAHIYRIKITKR
jgi:hypothetical protein